MISTVKNLNKPQWRWILLTGLFLFAFGSLFFTGCSQTPMDNGQDSSLASVQALEGAIQAPSAMSLSRGTIEPNPDPVVVIVGSDANEQVFGPDGGSMTLVVDVDTVVFSVPAGALSQDVTIHITGYKGVDQYGKVNFQYDCSPSGLQFNQTAMFLQPWSYGGSSVKSFFKTDDPNADWTLEEIVPVVNQTATIHVDHFSKYGVSN